jgi:hypothetical protein
MAMRRHGLLLSLLCVLCASRAAAEVRVVDDKHFRGDPKTGKGRTSGGFRG